LALKQLAAGWVANRAGIRIVFGAACEIAIQETVFNNNIMASAHLAAVLDRI
jgi:hypothetical protein